MDKKELFIKKICKIINIQKKKSLIVNVFFGNTDEYNESSPENTIELFKNDKSYIIDFKIDFEKEIFTKLNLDSFKVNIYFNNITFDEQVHFKNLKLNHLELKDVVFKKNVGIKDVCIETLILRPYEINANVVINVDKYADKNGFLVDTGDHYINNIDFEDPHVCNAKVYFIGTKFKNGDFKNRNLENIVFQNCNFENTYFINSFLDKTTFLNCKFPLIRNKFNTSFLPNNISLWIGFSLYLIGIYSIADIYVNSMNIWYLLSLFPILIIIIFILFVNFYIVEYNVPTKTNQLTKYSYSK